MEDKHYKNLGFVEPVLEDSDYKLGALPQNILQENGDWTEFLPPFEKQRRQFETSNCTAFATLNALESLMLRKFGLKVNYSDRALGVIAGTRPPGNDPKTVAHALHKFGVIDEELWPFSPDLKTVEEYYQELPKSIAKNAPKWLDIYEFGYEYAFTPKDAPEVKMSAIKESLQYSPLGISVYAWAKGENGKYIKAGQDNHWTMLTNPQGKVFDSYLDDDEPIKFLDKISDSAWCMRYYIEKKTLYKPTDKGLWYYVKELVEKIINLFR